MSSDEIIWSGKIQTDVEDKRTPLPAQRNNLLEKFKQSMNPTKDQYEAGNLDLPVAWIYKEGISVSI